jgi:DNA-binding LacI/PurR family transcriptional regulator
MSDATIQDVARVAGVSTASVSNLLNGRPERMRSQTRERIEAAISSLRYTPSGIARHLKTGHAPMLGLLVPTVANPYYGELAVAIEHAAHARGFHVLLCNTLREMKREREFAGELTAYGVKGLITASALSDPEELHTLVKTGVSIVAFDVLQRNINIHGIDVVTLDNAAATAIAVKTLFDLGHRNIAYATAPLGTRNREARSRGYRDALLQLGVSYERTVVGAPPRQDAIFGDTDLAGLGRRLASDIAALEPRPTAVVAMNDMLAVGLMTGLRALGLRIPHDISVVGIDDINLASLVTPMLTTVRQPFARIAETAVEHLLLRLKEPDRPGTETVFQPELVVRDSTSAPRMIEN